MKKAIILLVFGALLVLAGSAQAEISRQEAVNWATEYFRQEAGLTDEEFDQYRLSCIDEYQMDAHNKAWHIRFEHKAIYPISVGITVREKDGKVLYHDMEDVGARYEAFVRENPELSKAMLETKRWEDELNRKSYEWSYEEKARFYDENGYGPGGATTRLGRPGGGEPTVHEAIALAKETLSANFDFAAGELDSFLFDCAFLQDVALGDAKDGRQNYWYIRLREPEIDELGIHAMRFHVSIVAATRETEVHLYDLNGREESVLTSRIPDTLYYNPKGGKFFHGMQSCPDVAEAYRPMTTFSKRELAQEKYQHLTVCRTCILTGLFAEDVDFVYYNRNGGRFYHEDPECSSVNSKYLPLIELPREELAESPYNNLLPCTHCQ